MQYINHISAVDNEFIAYLPIGGLVAELVRPWCTNQC